ncbi:DUF2065 family protein [Rubellimicrobium aerolatum]|uniref:DUF2065 family protein n=1 Tax=Rubellimicrobium aerolatum TaxID=490979 RepID=A0ABW0SEH6_9RHOB|nr:DUF2065 family protein [Rubellimicrobium aerolatum]MBP1805636.1 uncharacterized protein YjeT (DUF2065 family) [Rubellimicrobium aerolatum]
MGLALVALGLVLVAEGLLWVLAPGLVEQLLALLRGLSVEERRLAGLAALALGLALLWAGRLLGAGLT